MTAMDPLRSTFRLSARLGALLFTLALLLGSQVEPVHAQSTQYRLDWDQVGLRDGQTACLGESVDFAVVVELKRRNRYVGVNHSLKISGDVLGGRGTLTPHEVRTKEIAGAFFTYQAENLGGETISFGVILPPGLPGIRVPTHISTGFIRFDVEACEYELDGIIEVEASAEGGRVAGRGVMRDVRLKPDAAFEEYTGTGDFVFTWVLVPPPGPCGPREPRPQLGSFKDIYLVS